MRYFIAIVFLYIALFAYAKPLAGAVSRDNVHPTAKPLAGAVSRDNVHPTAKPLAGAVSRDNVHPRQRRGRPATTASAGKQTAKPIKFQNVKVKAGDTLWSISREYLEDPKKWPEILKHNKQLSSSNPSIALPGMVLKVPINLLKEEYRAAKLVYFINNVLLRPRAKTDWESVVKNMDLYTSDTLRTTVDAKADVRFYTGEVLNLYPNSIVVLRPPDKKNTDVQLLAGEMRGLRTSVVTISARVVPKTKDTLFGAKIKDDLTTLVQIYKGKAEVNSQGKTVMVPEGFASEVRLDMPPSLPIKLPPLPEFDVINQTKFAKAKDEPLIKMDGSKLSMNVVKSKNEVQGKGINLLNGSAKMDLRYTEIEGVNTDKAISIPNPIRGYRVQAANDKEFLKIVHDKEYDVFDDVDFSEILPLGRYWIRISYVDLLGFEGKFNDPKLIIIK
ncbi:MAG: LysM peptidoglycan-binding domain-containing protein [Elusimicrobia bacterium]|nr:LysM peptidoglycan-binding domain-containing protein [Elusimicrobiota bacterium]